MKAIEGGQEDMTRQQITVVRMTLGFCALTFGQGACTATGRACYNTYPTCKDRANFDATEKTYVFSSAEAPLPFPGPRPYVTDVRYVPTEIKDNFTVSGRVNISLADEPDDDVGIDPYRDARGMVGSKGTVDISQVDVSPTGVSSPLGRYDVAGTYGGEDYYRLSWPVLGNWYLSYVSGRWGVRIGSHTGTLAWSAQATGTGAKAGLYDSTASALDAGSPEGQLAFSVDGASMVAGQSDALPAEALGRYVEAGVTAGKYYYDHESGDYRYQLHDGRPQIRTLPAGTVLFQAAVTAAPAGHMIKSVAGSGAEGCVRADFGPYIGGTPHRRARFWLRLLNRNRNYRGRLVEVFTGFAGQDFAEYEKTFVGRIENIEIDGAEVTLRLTDLLRGLAEVEVPSRIDCRLITDVAAVLEQITLSDVTKLPEAGYIIIGEEIIGYGALNTGTGVISDLERGAFNTVPADHRLGDKVGLVRYYAPALPAAILWDMLTNDAGLDTRHIETDRPYFYFRLEDDLEDSSGYGRHASEVTGTITHGDGVVGRAGVFDGGVAMFVPHAQFPRELTAFTLAFWIKFDRLDTADEEHLALLLDPGGASWLVIDRDAAGEINVSAAGTLGVQETITVPDPQNDRWYHLAVTFDGTRVRGYLDGVEHFSAAATVTATPMFSFALFGGLGVMLNFEGALDEVFMLNDRCLAGLEVAHLAAFPRPLAFDEATVPGVNFSAVITKPTKLSELYFEVVDLIDAKSWIAEDWRIKTRYNLPNHPARPYAAITDAENILNGSTAVDLNEDSRKTRTLVYWDKGALGDLEDLAAYRRLDMAVDADAEGEAEYGDVREKRFFCRWLRPRIAQEEHLERYIRNFLARRLFRTRDAAPILHCSVELKDDDILTGDWVRVTTDELADATGKDYTGKAFQVVRRDKRGAEIKLALLQVHPRLLCFVTPSAYPDWGEASLTQREYGYITRADGMMSDDDEGYHIY